MAEIICDMLFFELLNWCDISDISRLAQTCKQFRAQFNNIHFAPVCLLDTEIDTCDDARRFEELKQFLCSGWPRVVRAQLTLRGQPYSDSWEAAIMQDTEDACFSTLIKRKNGLQHGSMTRGVKDWRIIFLALCAGHVSEQNFGEFTLSQWVMLNYPLFFEFLLRFVTGFDGSMISFDEMLLKKMEKTGEVLETEFAIPGDQNVTIIHVMACQRKELSRVFYMKMMNKLFKELTPAITEEEYKMSKIVDREQQKKEVYEKMSQLLRRKYNVHVPDDIDNDLTEEELYDVHEGTDFNPITIAARFMNTEFGTFLLQAIHFYAKYYSETAKKDMIAAFVNERCNGEYDSVFHVMAKYGNNILKHEEAGTSRNNLGNQNRSDVQQFWKILVQHGADVNGLTLKNDHYAFRTQLIRKSMSLQMVNVFFDQLDALPESMRLVWLQNFGLRTGTRSDNTAWGCVMWAMLAKTKHCHILFQRMKPYVASLNTNIPVTNQILYLPDWAKTMQPAVNGVHWVYRTDAIDEPVLCKLVRFSKFMQLHNQFEYVMETAQTLLDAGADKTLRNRCSSLDVSGVTASELALIIAKNQPQFNLKERNNTDEIQISNLLRLHELLK